jgi:iron complex transport system substrate-binding protein
MSGGQNIGSVLSTPWAQISVEELLVQDPEVIVLGDSNYGVTAATVAARAGWSEIQAVKDGKIFPFDDNLVSRPGPRWVDGLEALAKLLHPDLFQ